MDTGQQKNSEDEIGEVNVLDRFFQGCWYNLKCKMGDMQKFINQMTAGDEGKTALDFAIEWKNKYIVEMLILNGADVNIKYKNETTELKPITL